MTDDSSSSEEWRIDRRTVLRTAAISGAGLVGASAFGGTATARGGKPCHKSFACEEGTYVKFELVEADDGTCYFEEKTDTGIFGGETGYLEVTETKEGDSCEPIRVEWDDEFYVATKVMAFGGNDCDTVSYPGGYYDARGTDEDDPRDGLTNGGGNTAAISNLQFCVVGKLDLPVDDVYIGYEDRPASGDFDYNDFGMDANITETYLDDELQTIELEFTSKVYRAGDDHLIHIQRDVPDGVEWDYTLSRSGSTSVVTSDVTPAGSGSGSGDLDLVLFDTGPLSNGDSTDATVTATVTITGGSVSPPTDSPRPDEAANNPLFEVYDPYMENTSQSTRIDLLTVQSGVNKSATGWDKAADVPNIVVVPVTDFTPPDEQVTITNNYPDFDDYYAGADVGDGQIDVDSNFDGWYSQ